MISPRLVQEAARNARLTLSTVLPLVLAFVAAGDSIGRDERPRFRPFLATLARAEGVALGLDEAALFSPPRDEQIASIYEDLAGLSDAVAATMEGDVGGRAGVRRGHGEVARERGG